MRSHYTTKELATLFDKPVKTILNWANSEHWRGQKRQGKGGGMEWFPHSLPQARRDKLTIALAFCYAAKSSKQTSQPVNREIFCQSLDGLPEHGQRKAGARNCIITAIKSLCEANPGTAISVIMEDFAALYRKRQAPVPAWVYESLPNVSRCSIRLWMQHVAQGGVRRLAKQHERRAPRNFISTNPLLHDFVTGMLYEYPHTSAAEIERGLVARFGPLGTAEDLTVKLPCLRRVQAWLKGWKKDNEQLLLAHVNPDVARSKHKAAFGNAAAHVLAMNQEWQSDGTLCELMLSDGRRHTLNLTIDVFTRRLKFHVSRTSSAAAVASGQRKCILAWGVPDLWKTDNGSDYKNSHTERVCASLGIFHELCPPFSPEKKPFVERAFKTFLHSHVELMQGYLGHSVAERKGIEARKSFADRLYKKLKTPGERIEMNISPEELQRVCDTWADHVYGNEAHGGLGGLSPMQKAAECGGPVRRITDERALDVLLLPCPGGKGLRTVVKKGLRITSKQHGLTIKGHYIGADVAALIGRKVLVRLDDTDLGRAYMFDPHTDEYLGKAEHPGWLGWTAEQVRTVSVAAVRNQKAGVAADKKAWKAAAKRANVGNIANEILETAVRKSAKAAPVSARETVEHITYQLEQAGRVRTGDFSPPTEAQQQQAMAKLEQLMQPKAKGFAVPENASAKQDFWRELYDRTVVGEALSEQESQWFFGYAKNPTCGAYCILHALTLPKQKTEAEEK